MSARRFLTKVLVGLSVRLPLPSGTYAEVAGSLIIADNGPDQTTTEASAGAFERANPRVYVDVMWGDNPKPLDVATPTSPFEEPKIQLWPPRRSDGMASAFWSICRTTPKR